MANNLNCASLQVPGQINDSLESYLFIQMMLALSVFH